MGGVTSRARRFQATKGLQRRSEDPSPVLCLDRGVGREPDVVVCLGRGAAPSCLPLLGWQVGIGLVAIQRGDERPL